MECTVSNHVPSNYQVLNYPHILEPREMGAEGRRLARSHDVDAREVCSRKKIGTEVETEACDTNRSFIFATHLSSHHRNMFFLPKLVCIAQENGRKRVGSPYRQAQGKGVALWTEAVDKR
jgi:hypothetical protein